MKGKSNNQRFLLCCFLLVTLTLGIQGCKSTKEAKLAKALMDSYALRSADALFGVSYDPADSFLVTSDEISKWIVQNEVPIERYPEEVRKMLEDENTLGLLVPGVIQEEGRAHGWDAILMAELAREWLEWEFWWISGGGFTDGEGGPCNGDFCTDCIGCEGLGSDGLYHTCVCVKTCRGICRPCLSCK